MSNSDVITVPPINVTNVTVERISIGTLDGYTIVQNNETMTVPNQPMRTMTPPRNPPLPQGNYRTEGYHVAKLPQAPSQSVSSLTPLVAPIPMNVSQTQYVPTSQWTSNQSVPMYTQPVYPVQNVPSSVGAMNGFRNMFGL